MTTSSSTGAEPAKLYPYPAIRRSGILALILGVSMLIGTAVLVYPFAYSIYFVGIAAAALAFSFFKERYLYGKPTPVQFLAINAALILGAILLIGLFVFLPDYASRTFLLAMLLIVGIDFIPLSIASGPMLLLLAVLCSLNALFGLWLQGISFSVFAGIDGVLKIVFGIWMLRVHPRIML